jgi:hypothetical protein
MTWLIVMEYLCHKWYVPLVVNTSRSFPQSRLTTGFVNKLTRRVPLVEQELLTLPEHLSSPPVFSGVRVTRSLAIVLSVLRRYTNSDCPFGIFKLFSHPMHVICKTDRYDRTDILLFFRSVPLSSLLVVGYRRCRRWDLLSFYFLLLF